MPVEHRAGYVPAGIHTSSPESPPRTPLPLSAPPLSAPGDRLPSEFLTAAYPPCPDPSEFPRGVPVAPDRFLTSNDRTALAPACPSRVQTPSPFLHPPRLPHADSSASRFLSETPG